MSRITRPHSISGQEFGTSRGEFFENELAGSDALDTEELLRFIYSLTTQGDVVDSQGSSTPSIGNSPQQYVHFAYTLCRSWNYGEEYSG